MYNFYCSSQSQTAKIILIFLHEHQDTCALFNSKKMQKTGCVRVNVPQFHRHPSTHVRIGKPSRRHFCFAFFFIASHTHTYIDFFQLFRFYFANIHFFTHFIYVSARRSLPKRPVHERASRFAFVRLLLYYIANIIITYIFLNFVFNYHIIILKYLNYKK